MSVNEFLGLMTLPSDPAPGTCTGLVYYNSSDGKVKHDNGTSIIDLLPVNLLDEDLTPDGAADYVLVYDDSDSQHKKVLLDNLPGGGGGSYDPRDYFIREHFISSNDDTDEQAIQGWREFTSGTGNSVSYSGEAGRPGVVIINGGTGAGGRAAIALGDSSGSGSRVVLGGTNPIDLEFLFKFPTAASFAPANLESMVTGYGLAWQPDAELPDGLFLRYHPAAPNSDVNLMLVATTGGVSTAVSSGIAPVANTWVRALIKFTPGVSATLLINGVLSATVATNIPTAVPLGVGMRVRGSGGVGCPCHWDYIFGSQVTDKEGV